MPLEFGRGAGAAQVTIDQARCSACGLCVRVCKGAPLYMDLEHERVQVDQSRLFGCIGCGQCAAVCPNGAITVNGRDLSPADLLPLPPVSQRAGYPALYQLMQARRSVRDFKSGDVEPAIIEQIITAASTAPMGLPPSEVSVLVFAGREKVQALHKSLVEQILQWRWLRSPLVLATARPFISKEDYLGYQQFVLPALNVYEEKAAAGEDVFLYNAPIAIYFYGSAFCDPADPYIAATYAMLAGEALGLGSCMLGFPGILFQYSDSLRKQWGMPAKIRGGLIVIFGYPAMKYQRAIRRRFAEMRFA